MSTRFLSNATIALAGGFVVVASMAFVPSVTAWLAFAVAIGVIAVVAVAQLDTARGFVQRGLDGLMVVLAVITLVMSLVFTGTAVMWLMFAFALGFVGLAYAGLAANEVAQWREARGLTPLRGLHVIEGIREHKLAA